MVTEFQNRVFAVTRRIPRGRVATYKAVAQAAGCMSSRAVGQALKRNPFAPRVPCHRVIASDLTIGGFEGEQAGAAIRKKIAMLAREGVAFENGKLKDSARLFALNPEP